MSGNIYSGFSEACRRYGDLPLLYEPKGLSYLKKTYNQTLRDIHSLISFLSRLALSPGEKVALLSENRYEWMVAYLSSVALGLTVVPLDPKLSFDHWKKNLEHSEARLLFVSDKVLAEHPGLISHDIGLGKFICFDSEKPPPSPATSLASLLKSSSSGDFSLELPVVSGEEIASLIYTSGTTGVPKGILLTHQNLIQGAHFMRRHSDAPGKMLSSMVPFHHIYGFAVFLATTQSGGSFTVYPKIDINIILQSFQKLKPHVITGVPAFYERLGKSIQNQVALEIPSWVRSYLKDPAYQLLGGQASDLQSIKKWFFKKVHRFLGGKLEYLTSGGAPLEPQIAKLFNLMGLPILEGYGLTETASMIAGNDTGPQHYRLGSVGKPCPGIQVKIDQQDSSEKGEICVKTPGIMRGYYKDPESTQVVFDSEGYFHTGDLGRLDSEGFLYVTGRLKDLIVTSLGKKISPEELELHFSSIPEIEELCVFGIGRPSSQNSEMIHLQILPNRQLANQQGREALESNIRKEVERLALSLPEFKRPQSLGFSEQPFPRTTTLKIRKFEVREDYLRRLKASPDLRPRGVAEDHLFQTPVGQMIHKVLQDFVSEGTPIHGASSLILDLGFNSLTLIELWSKLEEIFETRFPEEETVRLTQVGALLEYMESQTRLQTKIVAGDFTLVRKERTINTNLTEPLTVELPKLASQALGAYPRLRPFFLKAFRRFFQFFSHLKVQGLENLPAHGPFILAPNHESHLDNLFVASFLPPGIQKNMAVLGKKEHFDHWWTRIIAKICHTIPVDRDHVSQKTLQICGEILKEGHILLIHPEGTRSPDGHLLPFKDGVARLAYHHQCPVVPIYIEGSHEFWPKDSILPRHRSRITVTLLQPLSPPSCLERDNPHQLQEKVHQITEELWNRVALFSGEKGPSCRNSPTSFESMNSSSASLNEGGQQ